MSLLLRETHKGTVKFHGLMRERVGVTSVGENLWISRRGIFYFQLNFEKIKVILQNFCKKRCFFVSAKFLQETKNISKREFCEIQTIFARFSRKKIKSIFFLTLLAIYFKYLNVGYRISLKT
jgi:hypothetical protein